MLNNLFRVCWNLKNADIICYMLTLFVSLQQENSKQYEKLVKMVNIEGENLCIFWRTWGNSIKFSGKMWLMIILKVTKNQGFILSLENIFLETLQGEDQIDPPPPPSRFRVNQFCPCKVSTNVLRSVGYTLMKKLFSPNRLNDAMLSTVIVFNLFRNTSYVPNSI